MGYVHLLDNDRNDVVMEIRLSNRLPCEILPPKKFRFPIEMYRIMYNDTETIVLISSKLDDTHYDRNTVATIYAYYYLYHINLMRDRNSSVDREFSQYDLVSSDLDEMVDTVIAKQVPHINKHQALLWFLRYQLFWCNDHSSITCTKELRDRWISRANKINSQPIKDMQIYWTHNPYL